jgi:Cu-Zn family superoxide dismutase
MLTGKIVGERSRKATATLLCGRTVAQVHAGRDNYANIPERYHSHTEDVLGPDSVTKATGDAGDRFACGVVRRPN